MKSEISEFDMRNEENESPNTIHKIKHFCHKCNWNFNTCPHTICVQNLRSDWKENVVNRIAPMFELIDED